MSYITFVGKLGFVQRGFTLVELLITLAVMAIVIAIAAPSVTSQLKKMESQRVAQHLLSFFSEGRQDALIYQQPITLCLANANNQCVNNGDYLLRFLDKDDTNEFDASQDTLLYRTSLNPRYGRLLSRLGANNRSHIKLQGNTGKAVGYMGNIAYCPTDNNPQHSFKVILSMTVITLEKANTSLLTECQNTTQ